MAERMLNGSPLRINRDDAQRLRRPVDFALDGGLYRREENLQRIWRFAFNCTFIEAVR